MRNELHSDVSCMKRGVVPDLAKPLVRIACAFEQYSVAGSQIAAKTCKLNLELCSLICAVQIEDRLLRECHAC